MAFRHCFRSLGSVVNNNSQSIRTCILSPEIFSVSSSSSLPSSSSAMKNISSQHLARRSMVTLSVDEASGIGTLAMSSPPVNSISLEFMEAFVTTLESATTNPACKGLLLTSAVPRIFSAGLDITTMYKPDEEKARRFWHTFQRMWMDLYLCRLPTVAAMTGAAPAGGTILACSCDYRVWGDDERLRMGLNETLLGIVAPWWTIKMFTATVGQRESERALALGHLYSPAEALKVGLIDEAVAGDKVLEVAEAQLKKWMAIDAGARFATKKLLRQPLVDELLAFDREKDIDAFLNCICEPHTQKVMGAYLAQLQKKKR